MRQIGRAYKVDIAFRNKPEGTYTGIINLKTSITEVVKMLQLSDLNVKLEGNKLLIL